MASVCIRRRVSGKHGSTDRLTRTTNWSSTMRKCAGIARSNLESGAFFSYGTKTVRLALRYGIGRYTGALSYPRLQVSDSSFLQASWLRNPHYALSEPRLIALN